MPKVMLELTPEQMKDLDEVLTYLFEHEAEDFVNTLREQFPDDEDYIMECVQEDNWESIDKYAWNGTEDIPHIYAPAVRVWRALKEQEVI